MRFQAPIAVWLLLALALISSAGQQQPGSVDGQVSDSNTGEPIAGATLHLVPLRYQRGGSNAQPQATSQADGGFHFDSVPAGSYVVTADHAGFVPNKLDSKSQMISVSVGQAVTGIAVSLIPQGTISGVVTEEDGTPVPGARIEALAPQTTYGQTSLKLHATTTTDTQGKFSLSKLPPNSYYLIAEPDTKEPKPSKEGDLVRTIYPHSLDLDSGSTIQVSAGQSIPEIAIRLRRSTTFHVRGKVADAPGSKLTLAIAPHGAVDSLALTKKVTVSPAKTFDIGGLTPGDYTLRLTGEGAHGRSHSVLARQEVEIGGGNVEGIVLSAMPPLTITGQIRMDGSSNAALPRVSVIARPLEDVSHGSMGFAKVANDGTFSFNSLDPGLYVFQAYLVGTGYYIKSITLNQQDVFNKQADLSQMSSGRLEVTVSAGAGQVDVTIQPNGTDDAATDAGNTIVLAPETVGPDGSGVLFGFARQKASYSFKNVRPGKYFVYAVQRGDPNLWQNPDFLQVMQAQGASVEVAESGRQQLQLSVLPLEQVEQAAGRLGLQLQ